MDATLIPNAPTDDAMLCDDGKTPARTISTLAAFWLYVVAWLQDSARCILAGRMPSMPYYSRPMPVIPSLTGGVNYSLAASLQGKHRGGPQVFGGAWHAMARCRTAEYLPASIIVVTPGFAEVSTISGATHLVQRGWVARRRAMARAAALTFGVRPTLNRPRSAKA